MYYTLGFAIVLKDSLAVTINKLTFNCETIVAITNHATNYFGVLSPLSENIGGAEKERGLTNDQIRKHSIMTLSSYKIVY